MDKCKIYYEKRGTQNERNNTISSWCLPMYLIQFASIGWFFLVKLLSYVLAVSLLVVIIIAIILCSWFIPTVWLSNIAYYYVGGSMLVLSLCLKSFKSNVLIMITMRCFFLCIYSLLFFATTTDTSLSFFYFVSLLFLMQLVRECVMSALIPTCDDMMFHLTLLFLSLSAIHLP